MRHPDGQALIRPFAAEIQVNPMLAPVKRKVVCKEEMHGYPERKGDGDFLFGHAAFRR